MKVKHAILLVGVMTLAGSAFGQCRDPWVTDLVKKVKGSQAIGKGDGGECNPALYGSRWNSYDQLQSQMKVTFDNLRSAGLQYQSERVVRDLKFHTPFSDPYIGPRAQAPQKDQQAGPRGGYFWHIDLPNDHVMVALRKCPRSRGSAGGHNGSGCN